jgi:diacylglycerol kinase (ATP)
MKNQSIAIKLANAASGIAFTFRTENNFRIHTLVAILLLVAMSFIQPALVWWALILLCIGLVMAAELANTALETLIDHLHPEIHPQIGKAKDIMAGMVLVMSIASLLVGLLALLSVFSSVG